METDAGSKIAPIFPLSRVKKIMKTDKDVHMCTAEAVALTAMAAVLTKILIESHQTGFDIVCRKTFWNSSVMHSVNKQSRIVNELSAIKRQVHDKLLS